ncbi:hypothetical protein ACFUOZ_21105 [Paenarthrobacter sp. NPDC057355]|uniref:hypothetical protein n=1 Tax=Paenarthrobacter sp. NPDC057355 TaxID=3346105 RepID=UPI00363CE5C3
MTPTDMASSCRDFFLAGWTVADILHALNWRPDGTLWPHSGAPETKDAWRMRGWLRHRLSHWRTEAGEPLRSRDQQEAARAAALRREQEAEHRRILERQAERAAQLDVGDSPAKVTAIAKIRAMFDANKRTRSGRHVHSKSSILRAPAHMLDNRNQLTACTQPPGHHAREPHPPQPADVHSLLSDNTGHYFELRAASAIESASSARLRAVMSHSSSASSSIIRASTLVAANASAVASDRRSM